MSDTNDQNRASGADNDRNAPGALKGTTKITLHTRQARRLFRGRPKGEAKPNGDPKPPIPGVFGFGNLVKQAQVGSMNGDPYADWTLIKIDTEFDDVESFYDEIEKGLDDLLQGKSGFDVALHLSVNPSVEEVTFFSPYAFKACHVIIQADRIMTKLLGANHYALVKRRETEKTQNRVFSRVRRLFAMPAAYKFSGATRSDFLPHANARGRRAIEAYGAVPDKILEKTVQPAYGNWYSRDGENGHEEEDERRDGAQQTDGTLVTSVRAAAE